MHLATGSYISNLSSSPRLDRGAGNFYMKTTKKRVAVINLSHESAALKVPPKACSKIHHDVVFPRYTGTVLIEVP